MTIPLHHCNSSAAKLPRYGAKPEAQHGHYPWVLSLMFVAYGLSILSLTYAIRRHARTRGSKVGLVLLGASGVGAVSAAEFDLNQVALHELAGLLGIVCLPIAAVLITRTLVQTEPWSDVRKPLLWMADLTWISVLLWMASFLLMVATFLHVLGTLPTSVPKEVPPGAIAIVGGPIAFWSSRRGPGWPLWRGSRSGFAIALRRDARPQTP
ncbi:MAG TPA: DUF998 domain-containing protein [Candidatus Dormibacteraeota bacterium]|nr:DUF998 domain-containing protein [Candidatus Dormibacteraeota bacterium]